MSQLRKDKISKGLKQSWNNKTSGFYSVKRSQRIRITTKKNFAKGTKLRNKQITEVKKKWNDPNSKYNSDEYRQKLSESGKRYHCYKVDTDHICEYGCGKTAKYVFGNGRFCCEKNWQTCPAKRKESKDLILKELDKKSSWFNSKECFNKRREYMLNGGALNALSKQNIISAPQRKLYKLVCNICPYVILEYPCLNYSIDIAVPKLNIAIEYDGSYYHQDKIYDLQRQNELEKEGWKFIRYNDYIPQSKELYNDIRGVL